MKELFREQEFTRVAFFKGLLENEGIATFIRNQDLSSCAPAGYPISEFQPALCVVNDNDHPAAVDIIRRNLKGDSGCDAPDTACPACGEMNPANFDSCWSCQAAMRSV